MQAGAVVALVLVAAVVAESVVHLLNRHEQKKQKLGRAVLVCCFFRRNFQRLYCHSCESSCHSCESRNLTILPINPSNQDSFSVSILLSIFVSIFSFFFPPKLLLQCSDSHHTTIICCNCIWQKNYWAIFSFCVPIFYAQDCW